MVGVQFHIGQPIAFYIPARALAVQQYVVLHIIAGNKALHREHHAVFRLNEAHRPIEALPGGHHRIRRASVIEAGFGQRIELLLELAFRVVPHHHAPVVEIGQRLGKAPLQLLQYINFSHLVLLHFRQHVLELRVVHLYAVVQVDGYHLVGQVMQLLFKRNGFG